MGIELDETIKVWIAWGDGGVLRINKTHRTHANISSYFRYSRTIQIEALHTDAAGGTNCFLYVLKMHKIGLF